MPNLLAVSPFGGGSQPNQDSGLKVLQESAVGIGFGVMKFVHDYDVELCWI